MYALLVALASTLTGVVHVHHAPSHDSDASFEAVLAAGFAADLDFVVLTEHAEVSQRGPLPAAERAGVYTGPAGSRLLVLVGVELGTDDGHLLALDVPRMPAPASSSGRATIDAIHALGGMAVVPHPFSHGGWHDWDAPFDGLEVHNNASSLRRLGAMLPLAVLVAAWSPERALRFMLVRPERELERWESLLRRRRVLAFSGADAHQNVSILGWQLDPYEQMFRAVQTVCEGSALAPERIWGALREGRCLIRYPVLASRERTQLVVFPSGRRERWLRGGRRLVEIHQPPPAGEPTQ